MRSRCASVARMFDSIRFDRSPPLHSFSARRQRAAPRRADALDFRAELTIARPQAAQSTQSTHSTRHTRTRTRTATFTACCALYSDRCAVARELVDGRRAEWSAPLGASENTCRRHISFAAIRSSLLLSSHSHSHSLTRAHCSLAALEKRSILASVRVTVKHKLHHQSSTNCSYGATLEWL